MNVISLTKKLISIPSYVGDNCSEKNISEFLYNYLKRITWMTVIKQKVKGGRFNVIAKDKYPTKVIFSAHMDTVQSRNGWKMNQLRPIIRRDRIYGLGATDMKGGLAALISALEKFKTTKGVLLLLYVDEEYNFWGVKKFIKDYKNKLNPQFIISADGYDLRLGNGCRGLIEISFVVKGQTGHAGRPNEGKNAILKSVNAVNRLIAYLEKNYKDKTLGNSTCNLAFIQGGLELQINNKKQLAIGREGNNIADIAEFVLDIRPAVRSLNAASVVELMKRFIADEKLKLKKFTIRHDYGSWLTTKDELKDVKQIINDVVIVRYANLGLYGYIDTQMLWSEFNNAPAFTFGGGILKLAHKPNEFITLKNLEQTKNVYKALIKRLGGGEY